MNIVDIKPEEWKIGCEVCGKQATVIYSIRDKDGNIHNFCMDHYLEFVEKFKKEVENGSKTDHTDAT
ncbi:MAG: hypothetical protein ACP5JE_05165 [Thermoplasmata archaeon]